MRLLCDEMLGSMARWLRAAGHDTALAAPAQLDAQLLALCRAEDRVLITRDRRLAAEAAPEVQAVLLPDDDPDAQAATVAHALGLDWARAPFTRCLIDNTPLRAASPGEFARMPVQSRALAGPHCACPLCGRLYWPGSHVRRMRARLERWRELAPPPEG